VKFSNVRTESSLSPFFENNELSQYYEVARNNGRYDVARDIMKYQIMYEKSFFVNNEVEPHSFCFKKIYNARQNDILLIYPDKISISPKDVKFRVSNEIFANFKNNDLFLNLNDKILKNLEKDNGYFGSILKGGQPHNAFSL
jgi:hypothetical protein